MLEIGIRLIYRLYTFLISQNIAGCLSFSLNSFLSCDGGRVSDTGPEIEMPFHCAAIDCGRVLTGLISGKKGFFQLHDCSRSSKQCKMQIRIKVR